MFLRFLGREITGKIMWMSETMRSLSGLVLEMTVQEQERRVNHQKGEGEMERYGHIVQQTLF